MLIPLIPIWVYISCLFKVQAKFSFGSEFGQYTLFFFVLMLIQSGINLNEFKVQITKNFTIRNVSIDLTVTTKNN